MTAESLTDAMIGAAISRTPRTRPASAGPVLVQCDGLEVTGASGSGLRGASFTIRGGELVAVAGVEGNGQRELLRAVAQLQPPFRGLLEVARPIAFVPEDRTTEGLIPLLSLTENVVLGVGRIAPWIRGHRVRRVDWKAAGRRTAELMAQFDVRAKGPDTPAGTLSGGNQQKLLIARALERRPRVLVAENPTRGLDLQAAADVHAHLRAAASAGAAVLVYSNDIDEVLELGSRVLVAASGLVTEAPPGVDRERLGEMMLRSERSDAR